MNKTLARMTALGATSLLLLTALVVFIPSAVAQQGAVQVEVKIVNGDVPNGRLLPETGEIRNKIQVWVTVPATGACIQTFTVNYKATASPSYATVIFNPPSQSFTFKSAQQAPIAGGTPERAQTTDVEMIVTTKRDAPAFEDGRYEVQVDVIPTAQNTGGCAVAQGTNKGATTVKNDYLPLTLLNPAQLYVKAGQNKKVVFPVEVQNLGNGPTRIKVEATQPNKNKLDAINVGAEIRLESRAGKGAAAVFKTTRNVEVQTPHANGYSNSIYQFNVKYSSAFDGAASGQLQTDEQTLSMAVQVQGVYVPGFDPTLLIGALGIGLIFMRRRVRSA